MILVELTGGLGNQLFQYSAAKSLSIYHNKDLVLDVSSFYREDLPDLEVPRNFELYNFQNVSEIIESIINLKSGKCSRKFSEKSLLYRIRPAHKNFVYKEPHYHFDENFFKSRHDLCLKGGWQSYKYFDRIKGLLSSTLILKHELSDSIVKKYNDILAERYLAIHIRRGDYLRKPIILDWHGVMHRDYYLSAINLIQKEKKIDKILYFTDDIEWVEKELLPIASGEIVSKISQNHFEDFYLMQNASHNIIANSSFSWWAAYLNPNPNKIVIAPKKWFNNAPYDTKDLFPPDWILM